MTTYRAWDGNDYSSPPPDGWYEASDQQWWPEGYGPGPAVPMVADPAPIPSEAAPPPTAPPPVEAPPVGIPPMAAPPMAASPMGAPEAAPFADRFGADPTSVMPTAGFDAPGAPAPGAPPLAAEFQAPTGTADSSYGAPPGGVTGWAEPAPIGPPTGGSSGSSSRTGLLIGVVAALVILAAVAGAFVFLGGDDDDGGAVAFDPAAEKGTAANPHDAGDLVRISYTDPESGAPLEWTVEVLGAPSDVAATPGEEAVAGARMRVGLAQADAPKSLSTLTMRSVGPDGSRTDSGDCGDLESPLAFDRLLAVDESAEGGVCWTVPAEDLGSLTMVVEVDGIDGEIHLKLQ